MKDTNTIAQIIVLLFGIAVCMLSVWAMFVPERLRQLVRAIVQISTDCSLPSNRFSI